MYELYDPVTLMFFFRNKHMMCDFGTGNNNKLNWVLEDKQELIDIIETIYRGAKKGRGLVVSPKGMCTLPRYANIYANVCSRLLHEISLLVVVVSGRRSTTNMSGVHIAAQATNLLSGVHSIVVLCGSDSPKNTKGWSH